MATDFDVPRFTAWLAEVTGEPADVEVTPIRGGGSCEMFRVDRLGEPWVVRRAPVAAVSATAHQVIREARIMEILESQGIPVPKVLARSEDPAVLGAPFFVMSFVDGDVIRREGLPEALRQDPRSQDTIGEQLVDTLAQLHAVDWASTALAEMSHPDGFLGRQVDRWLGQLDSYRVRDLPDVGELAKWLREHLPQHGDLTVMHGDYKVDNVIWAPAAPPRIACVVDFEMTTVGDPLIDLAWAMIFWPEEGNPIALAAPGTPNGIHPDYCQSPEQLVDRYAANTGRDMSTFDWYQVFSAWKLAIVLEGSYAKHVRGQSRNPVHEVFGGIADSLLIRARRFAR
ncbi:phosphotransferase family protein [Mycolicibacterium aichiense]|uniref:Acyl-CoA dehydrogenase n=2 Tax=Mycolicibacterium TaxID=1866885 RepID=A0AAD1HIP1_9MYCO|nr:phosphotransferase family protein [Mycolicibacterium aichiense]MCV7021251.1 phosphotransferase family protein [Mycolicibacterium aichiense]BBX05831.1 acyl-CoA dehydrogenase [Mycolicibacterium aichiense]STZ24828.1 phosphotransferase enzyme family protein [Mycolicibacterium aichiense]